MFIIFTKRLLDIIFSTVGLAILSPIFLIIGILIKIDSKGSIFFKQERLGENGQIFKIYKFRTMVENAENIGAGLFTEENDSRITKIGKVLREKSIDELPQLINVLKGDMSLVGPRPPVPYHPYKFDEYSDEQKLRFEMKPGITGYAQISGRNDLSWDERISKDIYYVKNHSLWLDFKILFKTFGVIFNSKGIYDAEERIKEENKDE